MSHQTLPLLLFLLSPAQHLPILLAPFYSLAMYLAEVAAFTSEAAASMPGGKRAVAFLRARSFRFFLRTAVVVMFTPAAAAWLADQPYVPTWAAPALWAVAGAGTACAAAAVWCWGVVTAWMMLPEWGPPAWAVLLAYLVAVGVMAAFTILVCLLLLLLLLLLCVCVCVCVCV